MGERAPEEEVAEVQGAVEEEGSNSRPAKKDVQKEDVEDENVAIESQIVKPSSKQIEISPAGPKNPNPIVVEESTPEGALEEVTIPATEDKVQVVAPPVPMHQRPTFIKTLLNTSPNYDPLRTKRPKLPLMSSLKCEKHPFFGGLSNISEEAKSFFFYELLPMKEIYSANSGRTGLRYERSLSTGFFNQFKN